MQFKPTTATKKVFSLKNRIRAVAGGTSASKTISILIWCIDRAIAYPQQHGTPELISVVSETYPHLERGAMLDFKNIMKAHGYWDKGTWNETKHVYTFPGGTKIEFFSVDTYGKAHGPRRDILFVNEANNVDHKIFDQLRIRTRKIIWLDWNPSEEFWFYTELLPNEHDIDFITLTYLDNEALDQITIMDIEAHRHNKAWWTVYGLGQLGEVEGRVYTGWQAIDEVPHEARLERRGLDFGYAIDPAAVVDVYYHNGGYIFDEQLYQKGMSNRVLAQFLQNMEHPNTLIVADSAEPKSIDELREYGIGVMPANKGQGSINHGVNYVQAQRISYTKRSINLAKEYRRYFWETDKDGNIPPGAPPQKGNDHLLDAARYAMETLRPAEPLPPPRKKQYDAITGRVLS